MGVLTSTPTQTFSDGSLSSFAVGDSDVLSSPTAQVGDTDADGDVGGGDVPPAKEAVVSTGSPGASGDALSGAGAFLSGCSEDLGDDTDAREASSDVTVGSSGGTCEDPTGVISRVDGVADGALAASSWGSMDSVLGRGDELDGCCSLSDVRPCLAAQDVASCLSTVQEGDETGLPHR